MTVLDLLVLAEVLMRLMSRIIEIFLMIRERSAHSKPKPPKRSESRGELALPAARPYYTKTAVLRKENRCTTIGVARDLRQRVSKRASAHCSVSIPASRWGRRTR